MNFSGSPASRILLPLTVGRIAAAQPAVAGSKTFRFDTFTIEGH